MSAEINTTVVSALRLADAEAAAAAAQDGDSRWSLGGIWDGRSGAPMQNFLIREYARRGADPAAALPPPPGLPPHLQIPDARSQ